MGHWGKRKLLDRRGALIVAIFAITVVTATARPQTALGEERSCRGTLGRISLDNLRVPQGAKCKLNGTRLNGTITVQRGAVLVANGVRVNGNIHGENARKVIVRGSRVGGSIQVKQGGGATVSGSRVTHDIQFDSNRRVLRAHRNRVGGSIQVVGNTGGASLVRNVVDGNIDCKENRPAPTGRRNVAGEGKNDQCAGL
jgi:hypothetical protein